LGRAYFAAGRWRNAADSFMRGEPIIRIWPEMLLAYGESLLRARRFSEADDCFLTGLTRSPDDLAYALGRAECLVALKAWEAGLGLLNELRERGVASAKIYYLIGIAHHEMGHGNSGAVELEMAADLLEGDVDQLHELDRRRLFQALGEIALRDGRYDDARARLEQARELAPADAQITFLLAVALFRLGEASGAAEAAAASIEASGIKPDPDTFVLLGMARMATGDAKSAEEAFRRAIDLSPFCAEAFLAMGRIHMERGDWAEAEKALVRVKKVADSTPDLFELLREVSRQLGREINMDADVADISTFEIPEIFRPPEMPELSAPPFGKALVVHLRVVRALMVREMLTRFGKSSMGYLWALVQPLLMLGTLYFIFRFTGRRLPPGVPLETFLLTGVVPIYMFVQIKSRLTRAVKSNKSLFYFRQVTPLSTLVSRTFLEFGTYLVVFFLIYFGLNFFGQRVQIESYVNLLLSLGGLALLGFAAGSIFGVLMPRFSVLEHASMIVNRVIFMTSGMFFYGNELPPRLRDILLVNPIFHLIEFVRGAFFEAYTPHYASVTYVIMWIGCLLLLALALESVGRKFAA
ncbi:MAG TPA: tetratricopeptide repeat protein, partial [Magnetospirillum sp.]|nr:tetratricopeptide repeat protein [Magnetospirillum sp.]